MKFTLIILIIFSSFVSYSQDTSKRLQLPVPIARLVIKDIISGDSLRAELASTHTLLHYTELKAAAKDSIIGVFGRKESNYLQQIEAEKAVTALWQQQTSILQKENRKLNIKLKLTKIFGGLTLGVAAFLYLIK